MRFILHPILNATQIQVIDDTMSEDEHMSDSKQPGEMVDTSMGEVSITPPGSPPAATPTSTPTSTPDTTTSPSAPTPIVTTSPTQPSTHTLRVTPQEMENKYNHPSPAPSTASEVDMTKALSTTPSIFASHKGSPVHLRNDDDPRTKPLVDLLAQVILMKGKARLSPSIPKEVLEWLRQIDHHNNWGCDFLQVLDHPTVQTLFTMLGEGGSAQSGGGADDDATAAVVWELLRAEIVPGLFPGYNLLSIAAHGSDLFGHLSRALYIENLTNEEKEAYFFNTAPSQYGPLTKEHYDQHRLTIIALPRSYYTMNWGALSGSFLDGVTIKLVVMQNDCSYLPHEEPTDVDVLSLEEATFRDLDKFVKTRSDKGFKMMLIEPFLIPASGRVYSNRFLARLQSWCKLKEHSMLLVADEVLSSIRCGRPLYSEGVPDFHPDYVMIGKGSSCAMLLVSKNRPNPEDLETLMDRDFSLPAAGTVLIEVACLFTLYRTLHIAEHCRTEGKKILKYLRKRFVDGSSNVYVYGKGMCIFVVDGAIGLLPFNCLTSGRLLLRIDQTLESVQDAIEREQRVTSLAVGMNDPIAFNQCRAYNCAICAAQIRKDEALYDCPRCFHRYHSKCLVDFDVDAHCWFCTSRRQYGTGYLYGNMPLSEFIKYKFQKRPKASRRAAPRPIMPVTDIDSSLLASYPAYNPEVGVHLHKSHDRRIQLCASREIAPDTFVTELSGIIRVLKPDHSFSLGQLPVTIFGIDYMMDASSPGLDPVTGELYPPSTKMMPEHVEVLKGHPINRPIQEIGLGVGRFVGHDSHNPNLRIKVEDCPAVEGAIYKKVGEESINVDMDHPRFLLYTTRNVRANEVLTLNYDQVEFNNLQSVNMQLNSSTPQPPSAFEEQKQQQSNTQPSSSTSFGAASGQLGATTSSAQESLFGIDPNVAEEIKGKSSDYWNTIIAFYNSFENFKLDPTNKTYLNELSKSVTPHKIEFMRRLMNAKDQYGPTVFEGRQILQFTALTARTKQVVDEIVQQMSQASQSITAPWVYQTQAPSFRRPSSKPARFVHAPAAKAVEPSATVDSPGAPFELLTPNNMSEIRRRNEHVKESIELKNDKEVIGYYVNLEEVDLIMRHNPTRQYRFLVENVILALGAGDNGPCAALPFIYCSAFDNIHDVLPMTEAPIDVDGESYPNSEAYYQYWKFIHPSSTAPASAAAIEAAKYAAKIRAATTPELARQLGEATEQQHLQCPLWSRRRAFFMENALRGKFDSQPRLKELLLATDDYPLVSLDIDDYWGIGKDGRALNMHGRILMQLRGTYLSHRG